jgi:hypothetical protein
VIAGRASAFSDRDIIRMAREDFVPVTGDDWYQRRRQDAEGEFFRKMASQGPRKGEGGATRQGIYVLTADGELLSYKNAGQLTDVTREELQRALGKFYKLPDARRAPGAVTVGDPGKPDPNYTRTPPPGGLVVRVHARILDRKDGELGRGSCKTLGGDRASRDFFWLTGDEVRSLAPPKAEVGFTYDVPAAVRDRLLRFHLVDNTRGEPGFWRREDVRRAHMTLTVTAASREAVELRLDGDALLATDADPAKAGRGYDVRLGGELRYLPGKQTLDRFDAAAVGEHWGETPLTRGARPGRSLFGVAFGPIASGDKPDDRVPPQAAREFNRYFGKE